MIYTDHVSLTFLQSLKQSTTGRLLRWSLFLQSYNFEIKYRPGRKNSHADALSRLDLPPTTEGESTVDDTIIATIEPSCDKVETDRTLNVILDAELTGPDLHSFLDEDMAEQQRQCEELSPIIAYLENDVLPDNANDTRKLIIMSNEYIMHNGLLYHLFQPRSRKSSRSTICQLVIPKNLRQKILLGFHEGNAHPGSLRTYLTLRSKVYWVHLHRDVENHVASCTECQRCKIVTRRNPLQPLEILPAMSRWSFDILILPETSDGYKYLLLFVESLTRFPEAFALKTQTADVVAGILYDQIICRYGCMQYLLSDRAPAFVGSVISELSRKFGIKRLLTSAFHPQTNSQSEVINKTISSSLRILCQNEKDWVRHIPSILFSLRATVCPRLNYSPFQLLTGTQMRIGADVSLPSLEDHVVTAEDHAIRTAVRLAQIRDEARDRTKMFQDYNKEKYDRNSSIVSYKPGDLVWMLTPQVKPGLSKKLSLRYSGPFYIAHQLGMNTYMLRNRGNNRLLGHSVNSDRLKPYFDRLDYTSPQDLLSDENEPNLIEAPTPDESSELERRVPDDSIPDRDMPDPSSDANDEPRSNGWYAAKKLLALKKDGRDIYFKVMWEDKNSKPTWVHERDVTEALKREFYATRTKKGKKRKTIRR